MFVYFGLKAYIGAVDNQIDVGHVHKLMSVVNWSTDYGGGIAIQCLEEGREGGTVLNGHNTHCHWIAFESWNIHMKVSLHDVLVATH